MTKDKLKIGDILRVKQGGEYHYERVVQITPEILTEDMPEDENADVSTQGLADNLEYELIPNYKIAISLKTSLPYGVAFRITDRFFGSDYGMAHSTFEKAIQDTGFDGVTGIKII